MKSADPSSPGIRIGQGYDVHRLVEGRPLILGGVEIPSPLGLEGHSDADVLLHAICDALLGAAGLGDIGRHFPTTDPRFKGISSVLLLNHVADLLRRHRFAVGNVDATLILESPQISPYVDTMCQTIARALDVSQSQVSIKATTAEGLGAIGNRNGAAAHAVALITHR